MSKRTLDSFFKSPNKKAKLDETPTNPVVESTENNVKSREMTNTVLTGDTLSYTAHSTYPFPIANLPNYLSEPIEDLLTTFNGKAINNQPHLDLLYFQPLIPQPTADSLFKFLRSTLPFYRVKYTISRFGKETQINTPRYTTVFGLDETSWFSSSFAATTHNNHHDHDQATMSNTTALTTTITETLNPTKEVPRSKYKCTPRPIPPSLSLLLNVTEALTGDTFNFCLVNYYATGDDSISYHSDDERFLGTNPSIASFTLGARRDFLMKHKPPPSSSSAVAGTKSREQRQTPKVEDAAISASTPLKLSLASGDMVLMRGETQSNWLHSIPKRKGAEADRGRINITLRKAMVPAGTENYYRYNVGDGEVYRWNEKRKEMLPV